MNLKYAKRSEETEQIKVINWAKHYENEFPALKWLIHIPNGGKRNRDEAAKLKQMGVKAGVSDLFLPVSKKMLISETNELQQYHGLFIEMKFGDNDRTKQQKEFMYDMVNNGFYVATCYSANQAINVIYGYLTNKMKKCNNSIWKDEIFGQ